MRIAVLAWGSLIWDRKDLAIAEEFEQTGPRLPIEFCRVSKDGRLTLVIDELFGRRCITYSARSALDSLDAAIENLRIREGMPGPDGVGYAAHNGRKSSMTARERHPKSTETITAWMTDHGYDAVLWTALGSNFKEKVGCRFSAEAAIRYLEALNDDQLSRALGYIREAPAEIKTPTRKAVDMRWPPKKV